MTILIDVLGSGMAGKAVARAVYALSLVYPEWDVGPVNFLARGAALKQVSKADGEIRVLVIASPHAYHAQQILEGVRAGYQCLVVEKPSCVSLEQIEQLSSVSVPVGVFHGYRQGWGMSRVRELYAEGTLGVVHAVEGHYWQSSIAERATKGITRASWKSDPTANGDLDVLLDLGTHWTDLVFSLLGAHPVSTQIRMSSVLPERPSQDTHVAINFEYSSGAYAYASLSKVAHGAANELEINVLGTKGSVGWKGSAPDEIRISHGSKSMVERRASVMKGSGLPPFHGLGWNEGYAEILVDVLSEQMGVPHRPYPTLAESLAVLKVLLGAPRSCGVVP